jgi:hypothetical protein
MPQLTWSLIYQVNISRSRQIWFQLRFVNLRDSSDTQRLFLEFGKDFFERTVKCCLNRFNCRIEAMCGRVGVKL